MGPEADLAKAVILSIAARFEIMQRLAAAIHSDPKNAQFSFAVLPCIVLCADLELVHFATKRFSCTFKLAGLYAVHFMPVTT
jgi:hypothetical protein